MMRILSLAVALIVHVSAAKHVLFFLIDDAGFESTVYNNTVIDTPNLQKLAERGVSFTNCFTAVSSCSSSRASILTGQPPHQNGMYGLHQNEHHFNCFDDVDSLPLILHRNSIRTVGLNMSTNSEISNNYYKFTWHDGRANWEEQFFLMIAFHDVHRCRHSNPQYGAFCESFGNGRPGMGIIPDWEPRYYDPDKVVVPYFVPDTPTARQDISAQYTAINRVDQGIGLIMEEFRKRNLLDNTLIIYTSDNGIPFPSGRTNLYDPGMRVPLILSSPSTNRRGEISEAMVSLLNIAPTVADWLGISKQFDSQSLLPILQSEPTSGWNTVFSSHSLHEITMYYPMRVIRTRHFKLIQNLNNKMPFPIDQDFYISPTFLDLLNRSVEHSPTFWYKNLSSYYYRQRWELFRLKSDRKEAKNVAHVARFRRTFEHLKFKLKTWMKKTNDPWLCSPRAVLENIPYLSLNHRCMPLHNDEL